MESTLFEALTGSFGDALALFGGARQTRLTQQAQPKDSSLTVERAASLPSPGRISIGRVTYTYAQATASQLQGVAAQVGGASIPGIIATHPVGSAVLDVSGQWSETDGLRNALFLDTASGDDLANLGRSLGVLRNPMLANDDQYREVIKALAYARRGTRGAIAALLDALLGKGGYTLDEDPFGHPGQVVVGVPSGSQVSASSLGKTYVSSQDLTQPASDGTFTSPLPAYGHGALTLPPLSIAQQTTQAIPSAVAPAGTWAWTGPNEVNDVQLIPEAAAPTTSTRLLTLNGRYTSTQPQLLEPGRAELAMVCRIVRPEALGAQLGSVGATLPLGGRRGAWAARAQGGQTQVALINNTTHTAQSAWVSLPPGYVAITLRMSAQAASLWVQGKMVARVPVASLANTTTGRASFGNIAETAQAATGSSAPQLAVRSISLTAQPGRDYWQGEGVDAQAVAPDRIRLPNGGLSARHVDHLLVIQGGTASRGRNNGTYRIVEVLAADLCRVQGELQADGVLSSSGGISAFTPPAASLRFPDDLGKAIVVTSGGSGRQGTYPITALFEAITGKDLSTYATAGLRAGAGRATISGSVTPTSGLAWRLDPVMVAESGLSYILSDAGSQTTTGQTQLLTPWQPLPSATASYILPRRRVLGGVVRTKTSAYNRVAASGSPVRLLINPLYAHAPLDALDAYLPSAAGAGVDVVVRHG